MSEAKDIIDFNARFTRDFIAWSNKHPEVAKDEDKLELAAARARAKWFSSAKSWLGGVSPNEYFYEIDDAGKYVSLLIRYIEEDMVVPDPLLECVIDGGDDVYNLLVGVINIDDGGDIPADSLNTVRAYFIDIIEEMQRDHPYSRYITLLLGLTEACELSEALCRAFEGAPHTDYIKDLLYGAYPLAEGFSAALILDILTGLPDEDGRTADLVLAELSANKLELGLLAGYESTLMDERALPLLRQHLDDTDIDYFTYTQLRYAVEAITGELVEEKDFSGDADYEKIANLQEDEIFG